MPERDLPDRLVRFFLMPGLAAALCLAANGCAPAGGQEVPPAKSARLSTGDFVNGIPFGTIHYSLHLPESYDPAVPAPLFITLPGWEGTWPQGEGANLQESFPMEAAVYDPDMIIASVQLNGWDEQSGQDVAALTEHLMAEYSVDPDRIWLQGYSAGGQSASTAASLKPELYTAVLVVSSQWDGDINAVAKAGLPVRFCIVEGDTWYSTRPFEQAYDRLKQACGQAGWSSRQTEKLAVLDIRSQRWAKENGYDDPHAAGNGFGQDEAAMGWLFSQKKNRSQ